MGGGGSGGGWTVRHKAGLWFRQLAASSGAPEPERPIMPSEAWNDYVYIHLAAIMFIQLFI